MRERLLTSFERCLCLCIKKRREKSENIDEISIRESMERKRWRRDSENVSSENVINSILDENYGDYSDDEEIIFLRWSDDENDQELYDSEMEVLDGGGVDSGFLLKSSSRSSLSSSSSSRRVLPPASFSMYDGEEYEKEEEVDGPHEF